MSRRWLPSRFLTAGCLVILLATGAAALPVGISVPSADPPDPASLLPEQVLGYAPLEKDGVYSAETLHELIDGGAEVYLSFHVGRVVNRRYGKAGAPDILADLFDMGSSRDAFGAYHHDLRDGRDVSAGVESDMSGSSLAFWKDRYFVSIVALADTPDAQRAVQELGRAIAAKIGRTGAAPEILRLLPGDGLIKERISYFHDWTYLNTRHVIADENLLLLDGKSEGVLARYRDDSGKGAPPGTGSRPSHLLLIARYPSAERAKQALEKFQAGYLPGADRQGIARRSDGKWAAARTTGDLIVVVLDAAKKPDMGKLVSGIERARMR
jgi:hypothetical protein